MRRERGINETKQTQKSLRLKCDQVIMGKTCELQVIQKTAEVRKQREEKNA